MKLKINNAYLPIKNATTFYERLWGLIGKTDINYGILFPKCNSVHTYLMKEEIDIIGLNKNNEIIFIERNTKPNKIITIHQNIKKTSILELPKNTSKSLNIGDKLFFEFEDII